jgi:hypothetical protein
MVEVQDIFRLYGERYRRLRGSCMSPGQYKAMRHIESCRTAALGGHVDRCDECGHERISYNSCRDRHCPKCQFLKKEKWLEDRLSDFLPIGYFHVVFTIPDSLNPIMLNNQRIMYDLFFRSLRRTKSISGRESVSSPYCTPGGRIFRITRTYTASSPAADCRTTGRNGCIQKTIFSSRYKSWEDYSAGNFFRI